MRFDRLALILLLSGCADWSEPVRPGGPSVSDLRVQGVTYTAETATTGDPVSRLSTVVTMRNSSPDTIRLEFTDYCLLQMRAYTSAARNGVPVWDRVRQGGCGRLRTRITLGPGQAQRATAVVSALELLGDSLPSGVYHFEARLEPDGRTIHLPAGQTHLSR